MINPTDKNILEAVKHIKEGYPNEKIFNQLESKGYNLDEVADYLEEYFKENPLPKPSEQKPQSTTTTTDTTKQIPSIKQNEPVVELEEDISRGKLRDIFNKLKKDKDLKQQVYNKVFPSASEDFSVPLEPAIDWMIEQGHHPLVAREFVYRIKTHRLVPFKRRKIISKERFVGLRMEASLFDNIKDNPSKNIRDLIIKNANKKAGGSEK